MYFIVLGNMANASSAACQATSMTNKMRENWRKKQERERAASLDSSNVPTLSPVSETAVAGPPQPAAIKALPKSVPPIQSSDIIQSCKTGSQTSAHTQSPSLSSVTRMDSDVLPDKANISSQLAGLKISTNSSQDSNIDQAKTTSTGSLTSSILGRFSGMSRTRHMSESGPSSDNSNNSAIPGRRRHFSSDSGLSGDINMDNIIVSNS